MERFRVEVTGRTRLSVGGSEVALTPHQRAALAALAFHAPAPATTDRLLELTRVGRGPATARQSLLNQLSRLRSKAPGLIERTEQGYAFTEDVVVVESGGHDAPAIEGTAATVEYADLDGHPDVTVRREHLRRIARDDRSREATLLVDVDPVRAIALVGSLIDEDPYDEEHWWVLALAQARRGHRRAALHTLERARTTLDEIGLGPGERLRRLERAVLDDEIDLVTVARSAPTAHSVAGDARFSSGSPTPIGIDDIVEPILRRIHQGPSGAIAVVGPSGAGKSTTLATIAMAARARGATVVSVVCAPDASIPLQPIVDYVAHLHAQLPSTIDAIADRAALGALVPAVTDAVSGFVDRRRVLAAVADTVHHLPDPSVVMVEDLHWAPPRTAELIHRLAVEATATGGRVTVIVSARDDHTDAVDDLVEHGASIVAVPRWSDDDIDTYLARVEPDATRRRAATRWLRAETGGLPMYVRELTRHLLRRQAIGTSASGRFEPPSDVPRELTSALGVRITRVPHDARHALEVAAVIGSEMPVETLEAVRFARAELIADLVDRGLLVRSGERLRFDHELLRRSVLDRIPPAAMAELHDVVAGALATTASAMDLVRHALGAAALDPDRAVGVAVAAGHEALERSARGDAAEFWLAAADVLDTDPGSRCDARELRIAAGEQLLHAGDVRARALLFDAVGEAERDADWDQAAVAATIVSRLGPTSEAGTVDEPTAAMCDRLLQRLDAPGPRALLGAAATMVHSLAGHAGRCRDLFEAALRDAAEADDDEVWAHVVPHAYQSLPLPTDLERREELTERLLAVANRLGRADARWSGLQLHLANRMMRGDPSVRSIAAELARVTELVREQGRDWELRYQRAAIAHLDGDLEASERIITGSLEFVDTIAASRVTAVYGAQVLALRMASGRLAEMTDPVSALAESQPGVGAWRAAHALAAAHAGDVGAARRSFEAAVADRARRLDRHQTFVAALVALAETAIVLDDPRCAAEVIGLLEPFTGTWTWTGSCTLGPVDHSLAGLFHLLGHPDRARATIDAASRSADRLEAPVFVGAVADRRAMLR